jgi:hypothetical protein
MERPDWAVILKVTQPLKPGQERVFTIGDHQLKALSPRRPPQTQFYMVPLFHFLLATCQIFQKDLFPCYYSTFSAGQSPTHVMLPPETYLCSLI